ncbi:MAG: hypothetical protein LBK68_07885 [Candidatus Margulisbacteria bacterium]|nr:hypothetical protein [Candidatus Margulisiibacteriota bacterium]
MANNYTDSFAGDPYYILKGEQLSAAGMTAALNTKEKVANKQICSATTGDTADTLTNASSSDSYYPTSKLVGKNLDTLSTTISTGLNGKQNTITAGTANDILTKTTTAGTLGTLTKTTAVAATASASDDKIPTEKAVAAALGGKLNASDLDTLDTDVSTLKTTVTGLQKLLPVGTILMFDGTGWQDNETMVGWYRCIADNSGQGVPDLSSRFILGSTTRGQTGGSNALTAAMLPKHTHSIYTDATKDTARTANKTLTGYISGAYGWPYSSKIGGTSGICSITNENSYNGIKDVDVDNARIYIDATHNHTGSASADNSTTTDTNTNNMPAYYTVIYIMRVR